MQIGPVSLHRPEILHRFPELCLPIDAPPTRMLVTRYQCRQLEHKIPPVPARVRQFAVFRCLAVVGVVRYPLGQEMAQLCSGQVTVGAGGVTAALYRIHEQIREGAVVGNFLAGVAGGQELAYRFRRRPGNHRRRRGAGNVEDGTGEARVEDCQHMLRACLTDIFLEPAQRQSAAAKIARIARQGPVGWDQITLTRLGIAVARKPNQQPCLWIGAFFVKEILQRRFQRTAVKVLQDLDGKPLTCQRRRYLVGIPAGIGKIDPPIVIIDANDQGIRVGIKLDGLQHRGIDRSRRPDFNRNSSRLGVDHWRAERPCQQGCEQPEGGLSPHRPTDSV